MSTLYYKHEINIHLVKRKAMYSITKYVGLLFLIYLFNILPIVGGSSVFVFVCYALLCVNSSFTIILNRKRKLVALRLLSYCKDVLLL